MKLILTQEVDGLGEPGDIVEVKDGYGRNFLLPRGLATGWTKGGEKQIVQIKRARGARQIRDTETADAVRTKLESTKVTIAARAGEAGRLFGAITVGDVADAIAAAGGPTVDKRKVQIAQPIKNVGTHDVTVRLFTDVVAQVKLDVVAS
ncbi:MAG TPA: 50S ribosomal protein L9 [Candidatus Nanopelagicales bacterium]|jgi:large subunit ribosomal protein L9